MKIREKLLEITRRTVFLFYFHIENPSDLLQPLGKLSCSELHVFLPDRRWAKQPGLKVKVAECPSSPGAMTSPPGPTRVSRLCLCWGRGRWPGLAHSTSKDKAFEAMPTPGSHGHRAKWMSFSALFRMSTIEFAREI